MCASQEPGPNLCYCILVVGTNSILIDKYIFLFAGETEAPGKKSPTEGLK